MVFIVAEGLGFLEWETKGEIGINVCRRKHAMLFFINIAQLPHSSLSMLQSQIHTTVKITPLLHTLTSISFHILEPHLRTGSVSIPNMVPLKKVYIIFLFFLHEVYQSCFFLLELWNMNTGMHYEIWISPNLYLIPYPLFVTITHDWLQIPSNPIALIQISFLYLIYWFVSEVEDLGLQSLLALLQFQILLERIFWKKNTSNPQER